ncbi:MAG: septal ring lytic transglycosylase RlpA family protein [Desulfonatronovibrionaceae bacterium]
MRFKISALCLFLLMAVVALTLSGCSRKVYPPVSGKSHKAEKALSVAHPDIQDSSQDHYTVLGKKYLPLKSARGFTQEGIASWYGPKFHGRRTSSGEVFNMYELTGAHKILPMHTRVRVTNLDNSREVTLRINDRGPFVDNRIIDLSMAAARELDMIGPGTARVKIEALGKVSKDLLAGSFFVQVGSFASRQNAVRMQESFQKKGFSETRIKQALKNGRKLFRVQAGEFTNLAQAEQALERLKKNSPRAFIIAD